MIGVVFLELSSAKCIWINFFPSTKQQMSTMVGASALTTRPRISTLGYSNPRVVSISSGPNGGIYN